MHTSPEVLALLALGEPAADPEDTAHLRDCPQCQAEIDTLSRLTRLGRSTSAADTLEIPDERVWRAISRELGLAEAADAATAEPAGRPINGSSAARPDVIPLGSEGEPSGRATSARGRRALSLVLAAALALVAGIGLGLGIDRLRQPQETVIGQAKLTGLPEWAGSSGEATVRIDPQGNRQLVVRVSTDRPVDGNQQVWLINPDITGMQPVGFLNPDGSGRWPIPPAFDLGAFPIVDVSDEPPNDPNSAHSGNSIVRGQLQL